MYVNLTVKQLLIYVNKCKINDIIIYDKRGCISLYQGDNMKKLRYVFILIIFLFIGYIAYNHATVHAVNDQIYGNNVYRTTANDATIKFNSTIAGTYYYMITDNGTVPSIEDIKAANNSGEAVIGINTLTIDSLTSGIQYCYIIVSNDVTDSNIITISMPYDFYYFEDFETYDENTTISSGLMTYRIQYNGSGDGNQKVLISEQLNGSNGKVLQLQGVQSWASEVRIDLIPDDKKNYVMEANMKSVDGVSPGGINISANGVPGRWTHSIMRVSLDQGGVVADCNDAQVLYRGNNLYTSSKWYTVKMELDRVNNLGYISLDGVVLNPDGVTIESFVPEWFTLGAGNLGTNTTYFDNIRLYSTDEVSYHSVTFNPNGGSAVERQDNIPDGETVSEPSRPAKTDAAFAGWYSDSELNTPYDFNTPITKDITLYAKWVEVVNYDLWIGNTQVTNANSYDVFGDNKVSYDFDNNKLVLNNATINGIGDGNSGYGIKYSSTSDLTIDVYGNNIVTDINERNNSSSALLIDSSNVSVIVNDDSSIEFLGGKTTGDDSISSGINMNGTSGIITISGNGIFKSIGNESSDKSYGIITSGSVTVDNSKFIIKTLSDNSTSRALSGLLVLNNINAGGSKNIDGTNLELYNVDNNDTYKYIEAPYVEPQEEGLGGDNTEMVKGAEETKKDVNPITVDKILNTLSLFGISIIGLMTSISIKKNILKRYE